MNELIYFVGVACLLFTAGIVAWVSVVSYRSWSLKKFRRKVSNHPMIDAVTNDVKSLWRKHADLAYAHAETRTRLIAVEPKPKANKRKKK